MFPSHSQLSIDLGGSLVGAPGAPRGYSENHLCYRCCTNRTWESRPGLESKEVEGRGDKLDFVLLFTRRLATLSPTIPDRQTPCGLGLLAFDSLRPRLGPPRESACLLFDRGKGCRLTWN